MSLTCGLQSRGARYFFGICCCLFRSERRLTKPGQTHRKKGPPLCSARMTSPRGPQDPPGPGVSDIPAPRTPLDPRNDPPKDRDLDLHRRPVGPKQGLQKFRLQAPNKVSKNSVCDTGAHYTGVVPIYFRWCPLG